MLRRLPFARTDTPLLDKNGRLFGKYDLFVPLFLIIIIVLGIFIGKILLQKDTYITVELFASGGEWWWNNPDPPHWLTDPIKPGDIEYDPQGKPLVEVLDTKKFEAGDRKMLWMKARLKVTPSKGSKQYRFRREPLQVGSLIYVAPNNVRIASNVMWIEGISEEQTSSEKIITIQEYNVFPWLADAVHVGDVMKADDGTTLVEVLEKTIQPAQADIISLGAQVFGGGRSIEGKRLYMIPSEARKDITVKLRLVTTVSKGRHYFSYFQPIKIGFYIWIPLENVNISGNIIAVE